jgi:hypothetical protein
MAQMQPADPAARRKAIVIVVVATLIGLCAILAFEYYKQDIQLWLEHNLLYLIQNPWLVSLVGLLMAAPVIAASVYLLVLGQRTVRAQRFPPPHCAVSRPTPILEGRRAQRRGRLIQLLSLLILAAASAVPFAFWSILRVVGNAG